MGGGRIGELLGCCFSFGTEQQEYERVSMQDRDDESTIQSFDEDSGCFESCSSIFSAIWDPIVTFFSGIAAFFTGCYSPIKIEEDYRLIKAVLQHYNENDINSNICDKRMLFCLFSQMPSEITDQVRNIAIQKSADNRLEVIPEGPLDQGNVNLYLGENPMEVRRILVILANGLYDELKAVHGMS